MGLHIGNKTVYGDPLMRARVPTGACVDSSETVGAAQVA
jgi:hypothetical protein